MFWQNWSADPRERHTVWGTTLGQGVLWLRQLSPVSLAGLSLSSKHSVYLPCAILVHVLSSVFGVSQTQVQRYLSLPSLARATTAVYLNLLLTTVMLALVGWLGRQHNRLTSVPILACCFTKPLSMVLILSIRTILYILHYT